MDYRDEREALRARVAELEEKLTRAHEIIRSLGGVAPDGSPPLPRSEPLLLEKWRPQAGVALAILLITAGASTWVLLRRRAAAAARAAERARVVVPSAVPQEPFAAPRPPMFAAIEGPSTVDPIVWGTAEDKGCLAAFSAESGRRRWRVCPYAPKAVDDGRAAVVGDRLYVDFERKLDAFAVKTGEKVGTARLDERTFEYCPRADGTLRVSLEAGGGTFLVSSAPFALSPTQRAHDCQPRWDDWPWGERSLPGQAATKRGSLRPDAPAVEGMVPEMKLVNGTTTVVLGYARPGEHVPMGAAIDEKGKVIWKRALHPDDPLLADAGGPWFAALDDRLLCAPYPAHQGQRLGCWEAATGRTAWDVRIEEPIGGLHGIALTEEHVILLYWGGFGMFARGSGKLVHTLR